MVENIETANGEQQADSNSTSLRFNQIILSRIVNKDYNYFHVWKVVWYEALRSAIVYEFFICFPTNIFPISTL